MSNTSQIFRTRFLLDMTNAAKLHPYPGATLYALVANAYGMAMEGASAFPPDTMLEIPEQCRIQLQAGDAYAFGATFFASDAATASGTLAAIRSGLTHLGAASPVPRTVLGGNFRLACVEDLVAGKALKNGDRPSPMPNEKIEDEIRRMDGQTKLTLHFKTPLRASRPSAGVDEGHAFFDRKSFPLDVFLERLRGRARALGFAVDELSLPDFSNAGQVSENRLIWIDMSYGPKGRRKSLGGACGRVTVEILVPSIIKLLVLMQYLRVGESTRFGFGAYRIAELGADPFACRRSHSLVQLAYRKMAPDAKMARASQATNEIREAVAAVLAGEFKSHPYSRLQIPKADGGFRELSVPSLRDRAIQRRLLALLEPSLDAFFESSSFAYRKGFGRFRVAQALRDAFREGYRYAFRADFRRYFDSISHRELQDRLDAYIQDEPTTRLIMGWVKAGSPKAECGIPTGSPFSPLLGNLFLDEFDEKIAREGARLVRYADDFLVLFRSREEAQASRAKAEQAASDLLLTLNAEKSQLLDFDEPFDFLGFRFHKKDRWQADHRGRVVSVDDLGWFDAAPNAQAANVRLPGEQAFADESAAPLVVFGPARGSLRLHNGQLICDYRDGQSPTTVPIENVREVLLLGPVSLAHRAIRECALRDIAILLADPNGDVFATVNDHDAADDPVVLAAQLAAARDPRQRLTISRELLSAKVRNFAAVAEAFRGSPADERSHKELFVTVERMKTADSVEVLLGLEGSAAALWYSRLPCRLPDRFAFRKRIAPRAVDPINILLNIAYTALYRQSALALRLVGLSPSLGILHEPRSGHLALASDLMEPFRHVMERVVIEAAAELKPGQFREQPNGPFPVRIEPDAARRFNARIYEVMEQPVIAFGQVAARSYRLQLVAQARSLRRHLLDPDCAFETFRHYSP